MKSLLLVLALLSIPALASAQYPPDFIESETWTTFCDNGTQKVRASFVLELWDPIFYENWQGEWGAYPAACGLGEPACHAFEAAGTVVHLGGRLYEFYWDFPRECFADYAGREGRLWWQILIEGYPEHRYVDLLCSDGPQPILDGGDCPTLPVVSTTWGAVKALYR